MSWFRRAKEGILTPAEGKLEAPDGLWMQCPQCKKPSHIRDLIDNSHVCPYCGHHHHIGSAEYFELLFDGGKFEDLWPNLTSGDPLKFTDKRPYPVRIAAAQKDSGLKDSLRSAVGICGGHDLVIACMDFAFIGGSLGSVAGER
jgi:acetyl-CoA carboxylase carboxyl transferase subunit beta